MSETVVEGFRIVPIKCSPEALHLRTRGPVADAVSQSEIGSLLGVRGSALSALKFQTYVESEGVPSYWVWHSEPLTARRLPINWAVEGLCGRGSFWCGAVIVLKLGNNGEYQSMSRVDLPYVSRCFLSCSGASV